MKNKLSNEEIARVFSMYWGAEISINTSLVKKRIINGAGFNAIGELLIITNDGNFGITHWGIKLLLTPLSKLTDEDAIEVAKMETDSIIEEIKDKTSKHFKFGYMSDDGYQICHVFYSQLNANQFQYLIGKGYAVPIFISLNHPLNGLTPIELEIAREK